jgi:hypothetical protein
MFNRDNTGTGQMPPIAPVEPTFPALVTYEVMLMTGVWVKVEGHSAQIQDGCLTIHRGIFLDPACQQPGAVPAGFYAAGTWSHCRTDYRGYERKSGLSIN